MVMVYDIVTVAIILVCLLAGLKRGFTKIVITVCGMVLTLVVSKNLSVSLAPQIYDKFVHESVLKGTQTIVEKVDVSESLENMISQMKIEIPKEKIDEILNGSKGKISESLIQEFQSRGIDMNEGFLSEIINNALQRSLFDLRNGDDSVSQLLTSAVSGYIEKNKDKTLEIMDTFIQDNKISALSVEQNYIKPVIVKIVCAVTFMVLSIVMTIIVKLLAIFIDLTDTIPATHKINTVFGACFGIAEGVIIVMIIGVLVGYASQFMMGTKGQELFGQDTVSQTKIFHYFCSLKVIE